METGPTLTPRQLEVLKLATLPNKQIAQRLGISSSTVQQHLNHLYKKLVPSGKQPRITAIREAAARGLVDVHAMPLECDDATRK